ncbi:hypothetical protein BGZ54_007495 [Gamsiella multidivaricata]|nr:hypothetical protein BGZ54_007495 [Gamsiella multidivaricata]
MAKDKNSNPQSTATTAISYIRSGKNKGKDKDKDKDNGESSDMTRNSAKDLESESLAAIREKVSKFQPKIDSLLPRMLNRTAAATSKPTAVDQGTSRNTVNTTKQPTAVVASPTSKPKPKKGANSPVTSIASRFPKGSRAKPLPHKTPEVVAPTHPISTSGSPRVGDQPEQAIILSSPPSPPPFVEHDEDVDDDGNSKGIKDHESHYTRKAATRPILPQSDKHGRQSRPINSTSMAARIPTIISISSSRSDGSSSVIPSVQEDRIADWMGGVLEAMKQDQSIETSDVKIDSTSAAEIPTLARVKSETYDMPPKTNLEATNIEEPRKSVLRRLPPAIPRHTTVPPDSSPPRSPHPSRSPILVGSSLDENEVLSVEIVEKEIPCKGKDVLIKNSLPSLPPVPLFREIMEWDESNFKTTASSSKTTTAAAILTGTEAVEQNHYHHDDDLSTVVEQKPTQDSFVSHSSLMPFTCEMDEDDEHKEEELYDRLRREPKEPSLPSALTSSCLQELGLLKRKSNGRDSSRKRRFGDDLSPMDEDDGERDSVKQAHEIASAILAQEEVFPASIGAAPESPSLSSSLYNVIEAPEYSYALPYRTRQKEQDEMHTRSSQIQKLGADESGTSSQTGQRPLTGAWSELANVSLPSPPSQIVLSTLPSMPTFSSALDSEPSLTILNSKHGSQEEGKS